MQARPRDAALIRQGDAAHERRINQRRASGAACALAKTRKTRAPGRRCRRQVDPHMSLYTLSGQSVSQHPRARAPSKQSKLRGGACKRPVDVDTPRLFVPSTTQAVEAVRANSALACDNLLHGSIGGVASFCLFRPLSSFCRFRNFIVSVIHTHHPTTTITTMQHTHARAHGFRQQSWAQPTGFSLAPTGSRRCGNSHPRSRALHAHANLIPQPPLACPSVNL